ncbi:hypothetical protein EKO04_001242 [Ascochyta lentis]|uniref:Uncharacterized protein n=1 Tax=Ascochyta lentis TaxID=205686 RepID=A0A8H7JCA0_9PLEO|nr:hypothetical protein EKO04_001242 [Ascochyta lentis]
MQHSTPTTSQVAQQRNSSFVKRSSSSYEPLQEVQIESRHKVPSANAQTRTSAHWPVEPVSSNTLSQAGPSRQPPAGRSSPSTLIPWGKPYKPAVLHAPHPDSRLCQDFHWVPYPLGLLPYDSWFKLHHRPETAKEKSALCPACMKERKVTPHARKIFLVAERLSWEDGITSMHDKSLNEELNWAVNYELGILDPFVEDPEQVPGGKKSQMNIFYPYQNEYEMKLAFKYIFMTEDITETTWALWIGTQLDLQKMLGGDDESSVPRALKLHEDGLRILEKRSTRPKTPEPETIDLTESPPPKSRPVFGIPTPPSSFRRTGEMSENNSTAFANQAESASFKDSSGRPSYVDQHRRIVSYKTLQDFYGLLDKVERTSYVGALFLEAYAEKLRDDLCQACWLKRNINLDLY